MRPHNLPSLEERFFQRVSVVESGCWQWTGVVKANGYGSFSLGHSKTVNAHRWSYEHFIAPVPAGLVTDHLCRNRGCVNPNHLEPVTQSENLLRGDTRRGRRVTQCVHGHLFTEENSYIARSGARSCRECNRLRNERDRMRLVAQGLTSHGESRTRPFSRRPGKGTAHRRKVAAL